MADGLILAASVIFYPKGWCEYCRSRHLKVCFEVKAVRVQALECEEQVNIYRLYSEILLWYYSKLARHFIKQ